MRTRYRRITNKYYSELGGAPKVQGYDNNFKQMISELIELDVRVLQVLLDDLNSIYIAPWSGEYHRMLVATIQSTIFEGTILK